MLGDVGDYERVLQAIREHQAEAIIHFAGKIQPFESLANPLLYFEENTSNSIALLKAAVTEGVRYFLLSSSAAVYAPTSGPKVTEASATHPLTPYGRSKLMIEEILRDTTAAHPIKCIALRYFNVAGSDAQLRCGPTGVNPGHLIRTGIEVAMKRRPHLDVFGADYDTPDGTCVRDYIHVSDLANAHLVALDGLLGRESPNFSVMNCGYGRGASVLEVVAAFQNVLGRPLPHKISARRAGDAPALIADTTRLQSLGAWAPRFDSLESMISSALAWSRASTDLS